MLGLSVGARVADTEVTRFGSCCLQPQPLLSQELQRCLQTSDFSCCFFLSTRSEVSVTLRFWDALWMHRFYVRIIQVITPLLWSWPFPECLCFPPGRQRVQHILINLTEIPGDFVARKRFEDRSLLQVLIKFNCINLFGAGIIVLLRLCPTRSNMGSSWHMRPPRCFLRQIAVVPMWCKAVLRMTVEGFSPPLDALEAFHLHWATWVETDSLLLKTSWLWPGLKEQIKDVFPEITQDFVKEIEEPQCACTV